MMNGQMALLRVRQMAEADRLTVAAGTLAVDMMDHAGEAVAGEIGRRWKVRPVIVLCGPGNNGGDGFAAARHLVEAGWPVRIALLGARDHLAGEARYHAERWPATVEPLSPAVLDAAELVVDAIFGAGLSRELEGPAAETLAEAARRGLPIIAIDFRAALWGTPAKPWAPLRRF
jgi:NAD(P)H-hydrate epimerase